MDTKDQDQKQIRGSRGSLTDKTSTEVRQTDQSLQDFNEKPYNRLQSFVHHFGGGFIQKVLTFEPYYWPADVEKSKLHEMANSFGIEVNEEKDKQLCFCCGKNANKMKINWFHCDVNKTLSYNYGTAVPVYFAMIKYLLVVMFFMYLTHGIYLMFLTYYMCNHDKKCANIRQDICIDFGFIDLASFSLILKNNCLNEWEKELFIWFNFIQYLVICLAQFFMDLFTSRIQNSLNKPNSILSQQTLFLKFIPKSMSSDDVRLYLHKLAQKYKIKKFKIKDFFFLEDITQYNDTFRKRNNIFFKVQYMTKKKDIKLKAKKREYKMQIKQLTEQLQDRNIREFKGQAIVTFETSKQALRIKRALRKPWYFGFLIFIYQICKHIMKKNYFISKLNNFENISASNAPEPNEIKWENAGISRGYKIQLQWAANGYTVLLILICAGLYDLSIAKINNTLKYWWLLCIIMVFILAIYQIGIIILAKKRRGKTFTSKAYFISSRTLFFHLIFTIVVPLFYFIYNESVKALQLIFQMFLVFFGLIFLIYLANLKTFFHNLKKKKIIKQNMSDRYCQMELNRIFQKPEFPIEDHCLNIIKIWSFCSLQSFVCPFTIIFCIILMLSIYFLTKQQLFENYYIYRFKDLKFFRKYLIFFNLIFQFILLTIFLIFQWEFSKVTSFLAIGIQFVGIIVFFYRIQYRRKLKQQQQKKSHEEILLEKENHKYVQGYKYFYKKFLDQYTNPTLLAQINGYMQKKFSNEVIKVDVTDLFQFIKEEDISPDKINNISQYQINMTNTSPQRSDTTSSSFLENHN